MRSTFLILLLSLGVGGLWLSKSYHKPGEAQVPAKKQEVSEHNWAKHALDRTEEVKRQVAQHRQENDQR